MEKYRPWNKGVRRASRKPCYKAFLFSYDLQNGKHQGRLVYGNGTRNELQGALNPGESFVVLHYEYEKFHGDRLCHGR